MPLKSLVEFVVDLSIENKPNQTKPKIGEKKKQRRIKDDEIDNLVQLNRDKFQSSTLNYLTKPNQTKQVSFFLIFSFHLIDVLFDSFTFLKFN